MVPRPEIERSLEASTKEGVLAQLSFGIIDYYLIPYALFLGASAAEIGALVAVPNLLASVSQFFVVDVLHYMGDRRKLLLAGSLLQGAFLLPAAALPWAPAPGRMAILIALVSAYKIVGSVIGPAWGSLISDYLPGERRGRYLGRRSQLVGLSGMVNVAVWGAALSSLRAKSDQLAFLLLFAFAGAARMASSRYMARLVNLPERHEPAEWLSPRSLAARLRESNFARFALYASTMTFAAQVSSAYFSVHMLRDLRFGYLEYTAIQLAGSAASFLFFPAWGRHADLVGNALVLRLNSVLIPVIPLLWVLTEKPAYLFAVELFSGFVWGGFNLCAANFVYEAVAPEKRVRALGYFNLMTGASTFLGASLGGALADRLPAVLGHPLHTLFLISAILRFGADLFLSRSFAEVRASPVPASSTGLFFSVIGLAPIAGDTAEIEPRPAPQRSKEATGQ